MQQQNGIQQRIFTPATFRGALIGGGIALILIVLFLATAGEANPAWPKLWRIKPLLIVPFAGACGGAFLSFISQIPTQSKWLMVAARLLGIVVFIVGLWLGTVLGLNGTYWD